MVRRKLWTTLLAYNLIRSTAAAAAVLHQIRPREISFTSTVQFALQEWKLLSKGESTSEILAAFNNAFLKHSVNLNSGFHLSVRTSRAAFSCSPRSLMHCLLIPLTS